MTKRDPDAPIAVDATGFNALRMCRSGPLVYPRHDRFIGRSLARYGEYSQGETDLFRQIVRSGAIVVEAGANLGTHTVELSRLAGRAGQVHAYEPQRLVFQALCANLALNQCANVFARQAAASRTRGTLLVPAVDPETPANFGGVSLVGVQSGEPVDAIPVDALDLPHCHVIKADVEGMEIDVLAGAECTIRDYRPTLYLENDRIEHSQPLIEAVFALGYDAWWHIPPLFNPDNYYGEPTDDFRGIVSVNLLCAPREGKATIRGLRPVRSAREHWNDAG